MKWTYFIALFPLSALLGLLWHYLEESVKDSRMDREEWWKKDKENLQ